MADDARSTRPPSSDRIIELEGTVQGVGFRPFVARLAAELGIGGWIRNTPRGVTIRASGPAARAEQLIAALRERAPAAARITSLQIRDAAAGDEPANAPGGGGGFAILDSETADAAPAAATPDLAICADCRRELNRAGDRRFAYPFINCTLCGPRYSIIRALPYDRTRTTMAGFRMCPDCAREFASPADRRFHAQPNACPLCGPHIALLDADGWVLAERDDALAAVVEALRQGRIAAVKGVGGFHLMADAVNADAVRELRRRKHREEKPLAVMFGSLESARADAVVGEDEARALASPAAPIVLVRRRPESRLAPAIAPGNPWVGALLAYAPLHVLLLDRFGGPLVATSGNLSEEPLCIDEADARQRLGAIADVFLVHNRPIARPVDDSVMRWSGTGPVLLRRARGLAPAPFSLPPGAEAGPGLLCVGGHMKATVAVTTGRNVVLSPHIGDLGNAVTVGAFRQAVELLTSLHGARFDTVVCDAHPDYASTRYAESLGLAVVRVQHHLAHVLACLLEHGGGPDRVLGVAWDGTGYGSDGTIWGGEFILVDRARRRARRCGHLLPFRLPGGEAAVREPRRSALGLLHVLFEGDRDRIAPLLAKLGFEAAEASLLLDLLDRGLHAPVTTSAGRMFDGVAALLGLRQRNSFEAQAAMDLELAATTADRNVAPWSMPIVSVAGGHVAQLDWRPALFRLIAEHGHASAPTLAARFHASLAHGIAAVARHAGERTVVVTGGCFQNVRLLDATIAALRSHGHEALCHRELPPNDGSIAAGQALAARWGICDVA